MLAPHINVSKPDEGGILIVSYHYCNIYYIESSIGQRVVLQIATNSIFIFVKMVK